MYGASTGGVLSVGFVLGLIYYYSLNIGFDSVYVCNLSLKGIRRCVQTIMLFTSSFVKILGDITA